MRIKTAKRPLAGKITVPGDKSISHRGVMFGALAEGVTKVRGFLNGADCISTVECFRKMGIHIEIEGDTVMVCGKGLHGLKKPDGMLYTGNSGTTTRLLCGILAGQDFEAELDGDASIRKRPMRRVGEPLRQMGANMQGDYCPLKVGGAPVKGIEYTLPVASAQLKSAILLAALYASEKSVITEKEKSRDHTERMLRYMGADIQSEGNTITVVPGQNLKAMDIDVPADISSAAFFMVAAALVPGSELMLLNVGTNPTRTGIIDVLKAMGADITLSNERMWGEEPVADITVRASKLKATRIDGALVPRLIDELPVLAVAAAFAEGKTVIADAQELKVKETNRIAAVVQELTRAGVSVQETEDGMVITGGGKVHGAVFETYHDHRMAMSMAVLALAAEGESEILNPEVVDISFPNFYDLLLKVQGE